MDEYIDAVRSALVARGMRASRAQRLIEANLPMVMVQLAHGASAELCAMVISD